MKCIERGTLELYVLGALLDEDERRRIAAHLEDCTRCQEWKKTFQDFYRDVENVPPQSIENVARRILPFSSDETSILLEPMKPTMAGKNAYLLAAEGESLQQYSNIQSYINEKEDVLARILRDNRSKKKILYLLSDDNEAIKDSLLECEGFHQPLIPDAQGRVLLPDIPEDRLHDMRMLLKSPTASFDLHPMESAARMYPAEGKVLLESPEKVRLSIAIDDSNGGETYRIDLSEIDAAYANRDVDVVLIQEGNVQSVKAREGIAVFETLNIAESIKIHIY